MPARCNHVSDLRCSPPASALDSVRRSDLNTVVIEHVYSRSSALPKFGLLVEVFATLGYGIYFVQKKPSFATPRMPLLCHPGDLRDDMEAQMFKLYKTPIYS